MAAPSKYEPLRGFLAQAEGDEVPMRFDEIEQVLGFALPSSARRHPAWWSNHHGTNVAVNAWRGAGFRTARVDIGDERLVFVRDRPPAPAGHGVPGMAEEDGVFVSFERLTPAARRLLDDYRREIGGTADEAVARILHDAALERRRALIDKYARLSPSVPGDSTDLIRDERDAG
jgi:hypothetical protein